MPELLHDWVSLQAASRPQARAVVGEGGTLTYGALEELSNRIARALVDTGCDRGDRVCLLMPKSPAAIAALLGIYKADATYVPLDPACPAARLRTIVEACGSRFIIAARPLAGRLQEIGTSLRLIWLDDTPPPAWERRSLIVRADVLGRSDAPLRSRNGRGDPAHILFTSGSTGIPKGVVITHANVIQFVEWATRFFGIEPSDRISGHPPLHFDLSLFDIFGTFAAGASLHLVPPEISLLPHPLAEFIRASELTQWFSVPSALTYMTRFGAVRHGDFPRLRRLLWCGEVLPTPVLIDWMTRLPHVRFTNLYGPTETTIASSCYPVPACPADPSAPIPIGTACEGEALLVLDHDLRTVPPGTDGDLYIGGAGLSPGYWNDPEKTRQAFLADPRGSDPATRLYRTGDRARVGEDGLVYLLGREDSQIKSRGYRIELGEIEAALGAVGRLAEWAVVAVPSAGFEGTLICCAYVPARGIPAAPWTLRRELAARLPSYMLPARWKVLDRLPTNGTGKVDRRVIRSLFETDEPQADRHA
jgi:amino acid adenylation domain-containing protein